MNSRPFVDPLERAMFEDGLIEWPAIQAPSQEPDGTWSVTVRGKYHSGLTNAEAWQLYDGADDAIEVVQDRIKVAFYDR